ncbi:unnamed protein product, partial [marine sediment metagenome]
AIDMGIKDITPDQFISHLVDAEWDDRYNRRLDRLIKNARGDLHGPFKYLSKKVDGG